MPNANIVAGTNTYSVFSQPTSAGDPAKWRKEDAALPPMFRPTILQSARLNGTGTNVNETIKVTIPVALTVDGSVQATNSVIATATVTSLQNVTGTYVADAIDALVAALTAQKSAIVAGKTSL